MAGVRATITVDDAGARDVLVRIGEFGASPPRELFQEIGEAMHASWRDRAAEQVGPDGVAWVPLSEEYAAYKEKKRPGVTMLKFDLHMIGDQFAYQVGDAFVDLGTNAPYGAVQQLGGTPDMAPGPAAIPARPYLGLSEEDVKTVEEIVADYLNEVADAG